MSKLLPLALILAAICIIAVTLPSQVQSIATINIWKHRYPFYGGYGYGYPYWGGYGGYGGGLYLGGGYGR